MRKQLRRFILWVLEEPHAFRIKDHSTPLRRLQIREAGVLAASRLYPELDLRICTACGVQSVRGEGHKPNCEVTTILRVKDDQGVTRTIR